MKKLILGMASLLVITATLSGCSSIGEKSLSLWLIYVIAAVVALLLLVWCLFIVHKNKNWFILLFSSVSLVNIGYTLLSVSPNLQFALWANRISYLGSVFLPLSMMMIILNVTGTRYKKWVSQLLLCVALLVFLVAASPGILDIYYKDVSFTVVNGASALIKEYGPLHPIYMVYLFGYFVAMIAVIINSAVKKTIDSLSHSIVLVIAVFVNIVVWFIEQLTDINFEMLSFSYIITELFLLGVHLVIRENQRLRDLVAQKDEALLVLKTYKKGENTDNISAAAMECFLNGVETLTPTEREVYNSYLEGASTKRIMDTLGIKENTLKFHNKNIYSKLGVSSRKQLFQVYMAIKEKQESKR